MKTTKDLPSVAAMETSVHTDIVSTTRRTVTASLRGGEQRVIYRDGEFVLD